MCGKVKIKLAGMKVVDTMYVRQRCVYGKVKTKLACTKVVDRIYLFLVSSDDGLLPVVEL